MIPLRYCNGIDYIKRFSLKFIYFTTIEIHVNHIAEDHVPAPAIEVGQHLCVDRVLTNKLARYLNALKVKPYEFL